VGLSVWRNGADGEQGEFSVQTGKGTYRVGDECLARAGAVGVFCGGQYVCVIDVGNVYAPEQRLPAQSPVFVSGGYFQSRIKGQ
jgi:hypothetical protein